MTLSLFDATVPVFIQSLGNLTVWMDKALHQGLPEADILQVRLAPDMLPIPGQIQRASDTAKNAVGRLTGIPAPAMPDTEASMAALNARCRRTIEFLQSIDRSAFEGAGARVISLSYPKFGELRFGGAAYVTDYALPNFFFYVTTAYGLLRAAGVALGKADYLGRLVAQRPGTSA